LERPERHEWDTFVAGLAPGGELVTKLREFQFSIEAARLTGDRTNASVLGAAVLLEQMD